MKLLSHWTTISVLMIVLLVGGCLERNAYVLNPQKRSPKVFVEELDTSADSPFELCGQDDLARFLDILYCANGNRFYKTLTDGLAARDETFSATSPAGKNVMRFTGVCGVQEMEIFVTTEACDIKYLNLPPG